MNVLRSLDRNLEAYLMIALLGFATVIVFSQVVMRYVFDSSLSWSEEAARYMFIWLIYLGISYAAKHDRHIKVDVLLRIGFFSRMYPGLFSRDDKKIVTIFADIVFVLFALTIVYLGYEYTQTLFQRGQKTASLFGLPIWTIYAAIPIGYALCAFRLVQLIHSRIRGFKDDALFFSSDRENTP